MRQTLVLFLDAYRELNSKKMFWVVLILSGLVVAAFAGVGINDRGWSFFGMQFETLYNTNHIPRADFYKFVYSELGVAWWLNFLGIILALISTASIIPDFVSGGSIDLYLSKPISRTRLFLTKYLSALLFVTLQVLVFSLACFLVIGLRGGAWELRVFIAVPLVVLIFSFLYCVSVLIGLLTHSTIAALLLSILFWLCLFGIHFAETLTYMSRIAGEIESAAYQQQIQSIDAQIVDVNRQVAEGNQEARTRLGQLDERKRNLLAEQSSTDPDRRNMVSAHKILFGIKTILPKTGETDHLLSRWLEIRDERIQETSMERYREQHNSLFSAFKDRTKVQMNDPEVVQRLNRTIRSRPVSWILYTSIAFEAVILGISVWIFSRRDF